MIKQQLVVSLACIVLAACAAGPMPAPTAKPSAAPAPAVIEPAVAPVPEAVPVPATQPRAADASAQKKAAADRKKETGAKPNTAIVEPTPSAVATTVSLAGHIEISNGEAGEAAQAVVYFTPDAGAPKPKPGEYRIYTHRRAFDPPSIAIPLGSKIIFPNQDDILHNVFSATPGSEFDLGTYAEDERAAYTFKKAGVVTINCNVHQAMQANVLVLTTPYFATADRNGDFRLANLPAGPGKLGVWHPRANEQSRPLTVPLLEPLALPLALTKPAVSAHLNKERKQYQPSAQP